MAKLNDLNRELEIAARNALKKENESWQKINDEIKVFFLLFEIQADLCAN